MIWRLLWLLPLVAWVGCQLTLLIRLPSFPEPLPF